LILIFPQFLKACACSLLQGLSPGMDHSRILHSDMDPEGRVEILWQRTW